MSKKNNENMLSEFYEMRLKNDRANFRLAVSRKCGWNSERTFFRKLNGKSPLRKLEVEAIRKVNHELP